MMTKTATIDDLLALTNTWRRVRRDGRLVIQKKVNDTLYDTYSTFTVEELSYRVDDTGIEQPRLEVETEQGTYGDNDYGVLKIKGWREASENEIVAGIAEIDQTRENTARWEQRQIEALRRLRPEIFKD